MKTAVKILLFVFFVFLSTPTIVSLIENNTDTSYFYSMSEEEQALKEIKAEFRFNSTYELIDLSVMPSSLILSENLSKHDNIASTIFIPPPEQI